MCGIAGIAGRRPDRGALERMARAMLHRGPDDGGFHEGEDIGLAFRRLSIVDLADGAQPMGSADGQIQVVFNGEVYNHRELRRELEALGHVFVTDHSDTEVFVHGWRQWGNRLFERLNAMFAVAIWDAGARTLTLARDRYGIKPLYIAALPDGALAFASEIGAMLAAGVVARSPNPRGIIEYFSFQNLWGEETMFNGINQLSPGTILTHRAGRTVRTPYWDITFPRSRRASMPDLIGEHREIVERAIRRQIAADVPVTSYLSGGIDSTAITVVAHRHDPSVRVYSCIFDLNGVGDDRRVDERAFSRLVGAEFELDRVEHMLPQDSLRHCLDRYTRALEDLRMGMGYANFLIAERVARDAKVVLSGLGGDEFHAGYIARYTVLKLTEPGNAFSRLCDMEGAAMSNAERRRIYKLVLNAIFKKDQYPAIFTPEFLAATGGFEPDQQLNDMLARCPSDDWRDIVFYVDAKTYMAGLLTFEDKISMAHSLETRVPLLDNELADFVLDLPFEALAQGSTGKWIFREAVRPWVPEAIYNKPKMGFGPPDASWYRGILRPWIEAELNTDAIRRGGVFKPEYVKALLEAHFAGSADNTYLIWSLLNFVSWCRNYGFYGYDSKAA